MKMLEEFWYGNIEPSQFDTYTCKEYLESRQLVIRNKEKLQATMTDAQKELFARYMESQQELNDTAERLLFQNSFRLGARMIIEVMAES